MAQNKLSWAVSKGPPNTPEPSAFLKISIVLQWKEDLFKLSVHYKMVKNIVLCYLANCFSFIRDCHHYLK